MSTTHVTSAFGLNKNLLGHNLHRLKSRSCLTLVFTGQFQDGKQVWHRFFGRTSKEYKCFKGLVLTYEDETNKFEISYDGKEEHCFFDLLVDYSIGDLIGDYI